MKIKPGILLMIIGTLLIMSAAGMMAYNNWDENRAAKASEETAMTLLALIDEIKAQTQTTSGMDRNSDESGTDINYSGGSEKIKEEVSAVFQESIFDAAKPETAMNLIEIEGEAYIGAIAIQKLGLYLPVSATWSYAKLKNAPCRYSGAAYDGTLVVAAHNYKKHFGAISRLSYGDDVVFISADGNEYRYQVAEIATVNAKNIDGMIHSNYDLTLFTCNYDGAARIAVRCVNSQAN